MGWALITDFTFSWHITDLSFPHWSFQLSIWGCICKDTSPNMLFGRKRKLPLSLPWWWFYFCFCPSFLCDNCWLLPASVDLPVLNSSWKWSPTVCPLVSAIFTWCHVLRSRLSVNVYVWFHGWASIQSMDITSFVFFFLMYQLMEFSFYFFFFGYHKLLQTYRKFYTACVFMSIYRPGTGLTGSYGVNRRAVPLVSPPSNV